MPRWARWTVSVSSGAVAAHMALLTVALLAAVDRRRLGAGMWDFLASGAFLALLAWLGLGCAVALFLSLWVAPTGRAVADAALWAALLAAGCGMYVLGRDGAAWMQGAAGPLGSLGWPDSTLYLVWRHWPELAALAAGAACGGAGARWVWDHL